MHRWVAILGFCALIAQAQSFETASVKPSESSPRLATQRGELIGWAIEPPNVRAGHVTLPELILRAYEIQTSQLQGPIWGMSPTSKTSANGLFDLDATMPAGATASQIPAMLQKVLADRFGLKVHRIQNETDGLALVVAADGPKFSQIDTAIPTRIAPNADGSTRVETSTIGNLLMLIGISLSQTPVDRTGLRAMYEIRVDLPGPASPLPAGMTLMRVAPSVEAVGRALETLGLRLEREKRLVDAVYVDHVELTPTTN